MNFVIDENFVNTLAELVANKLVPLVVDEVEQRVKQHDEVLSAEQLHERVFHCYKDLQATRNNFLNRRDFPKIKRGTRNVYSLKAVTKYLENSK